MRRKCDGEAISHSDEYLERYYKILRDMARGMTAARLTDSISQNFLLQMIPQHIATAEISKNILRYTENEELKKAADQTIRNTTESIAEMRIALNKCVRQENEPTSLYKYQRRSDIIIRQMIGRMQGAKETKSVDCNYIFEMIPHLRGAVLMSENVMRYDNCPELATIVSSLISKKEAELMTLMTLHKKLGC